MTTEPRGVEPYPINSAAELVDFLRSSPELVEFLRGCKAPAIADDLADYLACAADSQESADGDGFLVPTPERLNEAAAALRDSASAIQELQRELEAAKREPCLADALFDSRNAQYRIEDQLEKWFGEDAILGIGWDNYDSSLEIYVGADLEGTLPMLEGHVEAIRAMGFQRFWTNYPDGSEQYCNGERKQKAGWNRWDNYNRHEDSKRRQDEQLAELRRQLAEAVEQHNLADSMYRSAVRQLSESRANALEEAARICIDAALSESYDENDRNAFYACASAIRAAISKKEEGKEAAE